MVDYVRSANKVMEKVAKYGRSITLIGHPAVSDPEKPWKGNSDPTGNTATKHSTKGVFVPPKAVSKFGLSALSESVEVVDLMTRSEEVIIIGLVGITDLKKFQTVQDGSSTWGIVAIQVLQPGDVPLLGYIGVRR